MKTVYIIQADKPLSKNINTFLSNKGFNCRLFYSAESALSALEGELPSLIVLDIDLPTHSGVEFLYELQSHSDWQKLPIIIISKNASLTDVLGQAFIAETGAPFISLSSSSLELLYGLCEELVSAPVQ